MNIPANQADVSGNNPNDPYQLTRRDWPDGRQLSYLTLSLPVENADGTLSFRTPGDVGEIMAQLNKDSATREDGTRGNLGAQKVAQAMQQESTKAVDDVFEKHRKEEEQRLETLRLAEARRLEEQRLEQARLDEIAYLEKKRLEEKWIKEHRPAEEAENKALLMMPVALAGLGGTVLMVTSGTGGPLAGLRSLLRMEVVGDMLATVNGTEKIVPGQPQQAANNPVYAQNLQA